MRCKAHSSRTGKRCRRHAMAGTTVCPMHGARAPQVPKRALDRLVELQPEAVRVFQLAARRAGRKNATPADVAVALRAADSLLDRTGVVARFGVDVDLRANVRSEYEHLTDEQLWQRIEERRQQLLAEPAKYKPPRRIVL